MKENVESVPLEATVTQIQPEAALCVRMEKPPTKKEAPPLHNVDRVRIFTALTRSLEWVFFSSISLYLFTCDHYP